jgi:hypothetical protein
VLFKDYFKTSIYNFILFHNIVILSLFDFTFLYIENNLLR